VNRRFDRGFFERPTLEVARGLLGATLVRELDGHRLAGRIVEVEAYVGSEDSACHASRGRTPRNSVMFGPPGRAYVYFSYGMHWLLNVVTEPEGKPAAVLLRAVEPTEGLEEIRRLRAGRSDLQLARGPARLCRALAVDGDFYGEDLVDGPRLFLEKGEALPENQVRRGPRIGVGYAAPRDVRAPWRIYLAHSPFVSRIPTVK
jgi:DNA-3-methyladenine glycosylase